MLFKEYHDIIKIEYHANQGIVFASKSSFCKDVFVNQRLNVYYHGIGMVGCGILFVPILPRERDQNRS